MSAAVTVVCGLVYVESQQQLREAADDPQVQMAEDAASRLGGGAPSTSLIPTVTVDMTSSLAPFVIVYDAHDMVIASSTTLGGRTPQLPAGVLSSARASGEDRVTWQPSPGVRIAAVVVANQYGAVLAGRSLRDVEVREANALDIAVAGWVAAEVALALVILVVEWAFERRRM